MKEPKKLLLVVDPQAGFKDEFTKDALNKIDEITSYFDIIFVSKFQNLRGSLYKRILHWNNFSNNKHSKYSNLAIKQTKDMKILKTHTYGKLTLRLRIYCWMHKINTIYLCGLQTDAGVLKTALDLFDASIEPIVIKDACGSKRGDLFHEAGLKILRRQIGEDQVLTFEELRDKLEPKIVEFDI